MKLIERDNPVLWTRAREVEESDRPLVDEYLVAMRYVLLWKNGYAVAAPQLGLGLRFFHCRTSLLPTLIVNPEIHSRSPEGTTEIEGCLSASGEKFRVWRAHEIEVSFTNIKDVRRRDKFTGLAARVFQHEFDHLNGICIFPNPTP